MDTIKHLRTIPSSIGTTWYLNRLEELKQQSPDLFLKERPISVCQRTSFEDRIVDTLANRIPTFGDDPEDPYEELNSQLHADLERRVVARVNRINLPILGQPQPAVIVKPKLPILEYRDLILDTIANHQVVVIRGATGCGKTTQVPQFILDSYIKERRGTACTILCTQPRRIAAISIAARVAAERHEELGKGNSVGYLIRCEHELPRAEGATIMFCTTGVLLRQLQRDPTLSHISHIIMDEVHERAKDSDVLLGILKLLLPHRPQLKLIIMSATIESTLFSAYFDQCPVVDVPGFMHTVEEVYLPQVERMINMPLQYPPDASATAKKRVWAAFLITLIKHIHEKKPPGAILVFVSGFDELMQLYKALMKLEDPSMNIYMLHSMVRVRRTKIFSAAPPGCRKIVLTTNVAESSITIDDVVYVIDNGQMKVMRYNPERNDYNFQAEPLSKANAVQRKGRAGRCQDGIVYRLYNKEMHERMPDWMGASITWECLDSLLLELKMLNVGSVRAFLATLLTPPPQRNISGCLENLRKMHALTDQFQLTRYGVRLSQLNLEPQLGQMLIYAYLFDCVETISTVVAFLSFKDIFLPGMAKDKDVNVEAMERFDAGHCSDHLIRARMMEEFMGLQVADQKEFCREHHCNWETMVQLMAMRKNICSSLIRNRFVKNSGQQVNRVPEQEGHIASAVICAGLYPNVAYYEPKTESGGGFLIRPSDAKMMQFSPLSFNSKRTALDSRSFTYYKAVQKNELALRESSMVSGMALILFARDIEFIEGDSGIIVDKTFSFACEPRFISLVKDLRMVMKNIFNATVNEHRGRRHSFVELEAIKLIGNILISGRVIGI